MSWLTASASKPSRYTLAHTKSVAQHMCDIGKLDAARLGQAHFLASIIEQPHILHVPVSAQPQAVHRYEQHNQSRKSGNDEAERTDHQLRLCALAAGSMSFEAKRTPALARHATSDPDGTEIPPEMMPDRSKRWKWLTSLLLPCTGATRSSGNRQTSRFSANGAMVLKSSTCQAICIVDVLKARGCVFG